jgi:hypothetical protein
LYDKAVGIHKIKYSQYALAVKERALTSGCGRNEIAAIAAIA